MRLFFVVKERERLKGMTFINGESGGLIKTIGALLGGLGGLMFGDYSILLGVLAGVMIADYITGILAAGSKAELSSKVGYKAIRRKLAMVIVVAVAHGADLALGTGGNLWRDVAAGFYVGNEVLSIFENVGKMDVIVPSQFKDAINKFLENSKNKDDEFHDPE